MGTDMNEILLSFPQQLRTEKKVRTMEHWRLTTTKTFLHYLNPQKQIQLKRNE